MHIPQEQLEERWSELPQELREEIFSDENDGFLEAITSHLGFDERKHQKLAYICLLVFSGFMRVKDVYEEACSTLGVDARTALAIYQDLDQHVFARQRAAIEANYRHFQEISSGAIPSADIIESPALSEHVVITNPASSSTVDLKAIQKQVSEQQAAQSQTHPLLQGEAPLIINFSSGGQQSTAPGAGQPAGAAFPFAAQHPSNPSIGYDVPAAFQPAASRQAPLVTARQSLAAQMPQQPAPDASQPYMLHQQQATTPLAQGAQAYKSASFGSFMGSFKGGFGKPAQPVSRASIEMPADPLQAPQPPRQHVLLQKRDVSQNDNPDAPAMEHPEQEVSFSVKKYAETPKVVNYGDLKTPLDT